MKLLEVMHLLLLGCKLIQVVQATWKVKKRRKRKLSSLRHLIRKT